MIDGIGLPTVGLGSGWAGLLLVAVLVFRGTLVPRRTLDDVLHDRDEWRAESRIKDTQLSEKDVQLRAVGEVGELSKQILTALARNAKEES